MTEEERYSKVESDKQKALTESNTTYADLLNSNSQLAQKQNDYISNWQTTQNEIADKNAAYQTELQLQNKQKAETEFNNEAIASKNAYYDFINPYGAKAETQAASGLANTGYSETTKLGAFNTQQNRTATARASMNNAKLQYDNVIKEIELNRDTTKAEYALSALQQQLEAAIKEFDTSSSLKQNQLSNNQNIDNEYSDRYNEVWDQINTENQFKEQIRQFDENIAYLKEKDAKEYQLEIQQLEEQKKQAQQEQANWEKEYQLSVQQAYANSSNSYSLSSNKISTQYYNGEINSDVQYGTFNTQDSNGTYYQPNNVAGSKLSYSGKKVSDYLGKGNTGSTGASIDNQKVWTTNGRYYIWDGSQNKYIDVTSKI